MEFGIVGIKSLIGVESKKSGRVMNAYILHMVRENQRDNRLCGCEVKQQFVDAGLLAADVKNLGDYDLLVGRRVDINYDDGGFIDSIQVMDPLPAAK